MNVNTNSKLLSGKLLALIQNSGILLFSIDEYYVQFSKDNENRIYFEAVSHNHVPSIGPAVRNNFSDLKFKLEPGNNYYKYVRVEDWLTIVSDVETIFTDIYKINYDQTFEFDDDIIYNSYKPGIQNNSGTIDPNSHKSSFKVSALGWIAILFCAYLGYNYFVNPEIGEEKVEVKNSVLDASVHQVESYLKNNLNDPDSYKGISWSAVFKLNDTKKEGFASYQVRHKYRAKNSFGGYVIEEELFKLDYKGNVVEVRDWLGY